jgi:hypothetical protein
VSCSVHKNSYIAAISDSTISKINRAVGEAVMLLPGEQTALLATLVSGYIELVSLNPSNSRYVEKLSGSLAEFLMERGRHNLERQLILLRDDNRKAYS